MTIKFLCFLFFDLFFDVAVSEDLIAVSPYYFCGFYGHASTKQNDELFVYGGRRDLRFLNNSATSHDGSLIKFDLSESWNVATGGPLMTLIPVTNVSSLPPSRLIGGGLFTNKNGEILLYGGGAANLTNSTQDPMSSSFVDDDVWSATPGLNDTLWSFHRTDSNRTSAPKHGSASEAKDHGLAFYFNGVVKNGSSLEPSNEMVVLDTWAKTTRTVSTLTIGPYSRAGASLQYVQEMGDNGALVLIGGGLIKNSETGSSHELGTDMASLDEIYILDIASLKGGDGKWYRQKTSGRTPESRADFCTVKVAAPDNSSLNIYMFAGRSTTGAFEDVWVLSLPQFRWTKVFHGVRVAFGAACELVGHKKMIVLGGKDARIRKDCDEPRIWLFDLTTLRWGTTYTKEEGPYQVPQALFEWIGGNASGYANMTKPEGGFSNDGLARLFSKVNTSTPIQGKFSTGTLLRIRFNLFALFLTALLSFQLLFW